VRGAGAGATGRGQGQATPPAAGQKLVQEDGTYRSRGQGQATPPAAGQKPVQEDGTYRSRLGWAETCNILYKSRKINHTPDWPHFSCIKFFKKKSLYIHAFHYITETFNTASNQQPFKNSLFRHFIVNNAKSSIHSLEFN